MINHYYRYIRSHLKIMDYRLEKILRENPPTKICDYDVARGIELFLIFANGYALTFMKSHKPFGVRCFLLDDNLAKVLGFGDIQRLKAVLPIRKSRRFVSVDNLRRAITKYGLRAMRLEPLPRKHTSRQEKKRK